MKYVLGLCLFTVFVCSWFLVSPANASRNCYIVAQKELDASAFQTHTNPNAKEMQCISTYKTITALGTCVDVAHNQLPTNLQFQIVPVIDRLVAWFRFGMKDVQGLRDEHDQDCLQYVDTMFVPPNLTE